MTRRAIFEKTLYIALTSLFVALAIRLPVYPDEEQWLYINSRQFIDGTMQYLFPACSQGFKLEMPWIWAPVRSVFWLLYSKFGLIDHIRMMGILQAALTLVGIRVFISQYSRNKLEAHKVWRPLLILGTFPFLLVLNRPEQPLFLFFLGSAYLGHVLPKIVSKSGRVFARTLQVLILISMPAIHPKGVLFSLMALSLLIFQSGRVSKRTPFPEIGLTVFSIWESSKIWNNRTLCPESVFITDTFKNITLNPTKLDSSTPLMVFGNIIRAPKYLLHMFYQQSYQSNWLAQDETIPLFLVILGNIAILGFCIFILKALARNLVIRTLNSRTLDLSGFIAVILVSGSFSLLLLQRTKNFYDSYLVVLLLVLAAAITFESKSTTRNYRIAFTPQMVCLLVIPALCFTLINIAPDKQGENNAIGRQIVNLCGITSKQIASGNFIIDPSLTRYFWDSPRFVYSSYVWGWWAQDVKAVNIVERLNPPVIIIRNENLLKPEPGDVTVGDFYCRNSTRHEQ